MKRFKDLSIAKKLVTLFAAVTAMFAIGAGYLIIRFSNQYLISQVKAIYSNDASAYMSMIDMLMWKHYRDIKSFAQAGILTRGTGTPEEITKWLKAKKDQYSYASLSYFDMNRIRIADTEGLQLGKQHDMVRYWEDVLAGRVSAGSDVRIAEELKVPVIYFASPVKGPGGRPIGVVVARDNGSDIAMVLQSLAKAGGGPLDVTLFDKDRNIIFSTCEVLKNWVLKKKIPMSPSVSAVLGGRDGASLETLPSEYLPYEKGEFITAYARERGYGDFKGNDWSLILKSPKTQALAPVEKFKVVIIGIFLGAVLVICATGFLLSRSISGPILRLTEVVKRFGKGDLSQKAETAANDEIGELAVSFNQMAADIKRSTEVLQQANEEVKKAKEAAEQKAEQLERFNKVAVGRELKMRELKERIKELEEKINKQ